MGHALPEADLGAHLDPERDRCPFCSHIGTWNRGSHPARSGMPWVYIARRPGGSCSGPAEGVHEANTVNPQFSTVGLAGEGVERG